MHVVALLLPGHIGFVHTYCLTKKFCCYAECIPALSVEACVPCFVSSLHFRCIVAFWDNRSFLSQNTVTWMYRLLKYSVLLFIYLVFQQNFQSTKLQKWAYFCI